MVRQAHHERTANRTANNRMALVETSPRIAPVRRSGFSASTRAVGDGSPRHRRACTPYSPHVIPVLLFPDIWPDATIESLAKRAGVYVIWGTEDRLDDLEGIVWSRGVSDRLNMESIAAEVRP